MYVIESRAHDIFFLSQLASSIFLKNFGAVFIFFSWHPRAKRCEERLFQWFAPTKNDPQTLQRYGVHQGESEGRWMLGFIELWDWYSLCTVYVQSEYSLSTVCVNALERFENHARTCVCRSGTAQKSAQMRKFLNTLIDMQVFGLIFAFVYVFFDVFLHYLCIVLVITYSLSL